MNVKIGSGWDCANGPIDARSIKVSVRQETSVRLI